MTVLHSRIFSRFPGLRHGMATLRYQPLTFHGHRLTAVATARKRFLRTLGIPLAELTLARQVHGTNVHIIEEGERGRGAKHPSTYINKTDALLTQRPGIALGIFTADCTPVLLHDPVTGWIGAIHAGWKGIARGIVPKTLHVLANHGVRMADVRVWLGPCICAHCYTTPDKHRAQEFWKSVGPVGARLVGKLYHLDLQQALQVQLRRAGIRSQHVEVSTTCTKTSPTLPSSRRQGPTHPNTLTVIRRENIPHDLRGKAVVVFGLGVLGGGVASTRFAVRQHAKVHVVDALPPHALKASLQALQGLPITYHLGPTQAKRLPKADLVIVNPGVRPDHPALRVAKRAGTFIASDLSLFRASSSNPIIAVTGTKGKTTVATWLAHVLVKRKPVLAGNLQKSPLHIPAAFDGKTPVVLEVSSFQLEHLDIPLLPQLSIITNLYPDHLNRHGTMRAYAKEKNRLLTAAGPNILPLDSDWKKFAPAATYAHTYWTSDRPSVKAHAWLQNGWVMLRSGRREIRVLATSALKNQDQATMRNAVTVALGGQLLGLTLVTIRKGLRTFTGVPQRFEVIRRYKGRTFINSTTATNPIAALTALASVRGRCILLAGGSNKNLPMANFAKTLQARKVQVILLAGSATNELQGRLGRATPITKSMQVAVRLAWQRSAPGDTILLAPGAASFGMFRNEFDRGEQFVRYVKQLR